MAFVACLRISAFLAVPDDVRQEDSATSVYLSTIPTEREPQLRLILECSGCDLSVDQKRG